MSRTIREATSPAPPKERMVGIGQGLLRQLPGLVPTKMHVVEEDAHQLRYRHTRMRVVELDGYQVRQGTPIGVVSPETAHHIRERTSHEEVFLYKAESL